VKAIILAAGYATRLYPLTKDRAKALLPINNRPMIDYILDKIETVKEIDEVFVVTNSRFAQQFIEWSKNVDTSLPITILDDGTDSDENKRGAIGDLYFVLEEANIQDDLMVIAGDNYFTYSLEAYMDFFVEKGGDCVCAKICADKEALKQFAVAQVDEDHRVIEIEEKPQVPKSDLAVYAAYFYKKETLPLFKEYLEEGNSPDAPGNFPVWLCKRQAVYAYPFTGECYDIGTPESYYEVERLVAEGKI